jgi:hypothetical protein
MIFENDGIKYTVIPMSGWHSRLYAALSLDVLKILAVNAGIKFDNVNLILKHVPNTLLGTYEYFVKFCLTTSAESGYFTDYEISLLHQVPAAYREWLKLFAQPGFYDIWLEAYLKENKEQDDDDSQKKETTGA